MFLSEHNKKGTGITIISGDINKKGQNVSSGRGIPAVPGTIYSGAQGVSYQHMILM